VRGSHANLESTGDNPLRVPEGFVSLVEDRFRLIAREPDVTAIVRAGVLRFRDPARWTGGTTEALGGGRGPVRRVTLSGEFPMTVMVKPLLRGGVLRRLNHDIHLSSSRLADEARLSQHLRRHGVAASEMVFGRAERLIGPFYRLHLATAEIPGAVSLFDYLSGSATGRFHHADVLKAAGECVRKLHESGVFHADLNLKNILIAHGLEGGEQNPRAHVIDLDGSRLEPCVTRRARSSNLARLLRHAVKNGLHRSLDIAGLGRHFLEGYCGDSDPDRFGSEVIKSFKRTFPFHRISWRMQGIDVPVLPFES